MEYTDEEIINVLERCISSITCLDCPLADGECMKLPVHELDLITRQKAEIERLEKELMKCKLEKEMLYQTVEEIKSEAIKEFADRLKNLWYDNRYDSPDIEFDYFVDNLVKEMTKES